MLTASKVKKSSSFQALIAALSKTLLLRESDTCTTRWLVHLVVVGRSVAVSFFVWSLLSFDHSKLDSQPPVGSPHPRYQRSETSLEHFLFNVPKVAWFNHRVAHTLSFAGIPIVGIQISNTYGYGVHSIWETSQFPWSPY